MRFRIVQLYERGVHRDWKVIRAAEPVEGNLDINQDQFNPMKRISLKARVGASMPMEEDPLPPLYDVQLGGMAPLAFTLHGFEFVDGVAYQQVWHCKETLGKANVVFISELGELI